MKYKIGDKVKINMTKIQCGDAFYFFIDRLPDRTTKIEKVFAGMYVLEDVPTLFPEEFLEEVLEPIRNRWEILDL